MVPILAVLAAVLLLAAGCGGGKKETTTAAAAATGAAATTTVTMKTSEGTFAFDLDVKDSPHTTASFVKLVEKGFFDGLTFHRVVPGFVIQGGDPKGDGTGGPGYSTVDTPPAAAKYTKGVVAMAKTSDEPAGTAGSQFFVVTGADAGLPPDYALLGNVTSGMDVVDKIDKLGTPGDPNGVPTKKITIEKATVAES